jgi:hypothetical protein
MERQPQLGCFASAMYLYYDGFGVPESAVDEALECRSGSAPTLTRWPH